MDLVLADGLGAESAKLGSGGSTPLEDTDREAR